MRHQILLWGLLENHQGDTAMRARNLKPGVFKNEILGQADPLVTLLFEGLWCLADKAGRLEDRPLRIKGELFPYREGLDVNGYLTDLERWGFIRRYQVEGQRLIQVVNFDKHQSPHHTERASELHGITDGCITSVDSPLSNGGNPSDSLFTDSLVPTPVVPPLPPKGEPADAGADGKKSRRVSKRAQQLQIAELSMPAPMAQAWEKVKAAWPRKGWNSTTRSEQPRFTNPARAGAWFKTICDDAPIELAAGQRLTPDDLADATLSWLEKRLKEVPRGGYPVVPCIENFFSCDPSSKLHWQSALLEFFGTAVAS